MSGTLTLPTGKPLQVSPGNLPSFYKSAGSQRRMHFGAGKPCMASVQSFAESATVESRKSASLYEILRVERTASPMEIKTAYRSLAKVYHPDAMNQQSESDGRKGRDFIEIHNAYSTLSDPVARAVYDLSLGARQRRGSFGYSGGIRTGYYQTSRWETDQCW